MKKYLLSALFILVLLLLCSCGEGKLIFPFEADLEKYYTALLRLDDGSVVPDSALIDTSNDAVILENTAFSATLVGLTGALSLCDKKSGEYYDMTGALLSSPSEASSALFVEGEEIPDFSFIQAKFYDTVYEKYRPTLTAFYLDDTTVRLIYLLGAEQLSFFRDYPVLLSERTYKASESVFADKYQKQNTSLSDTNAWFVSSFCTETEYYALTADALSSLPDDADANMARSELLLLGYDPQKTLVYLFVADISLTDNGFNIDVSPQRQYKSAALRTSAFYFELFEGELPFVTRTETESEKITYAGSKY